VEAFFLANEPRAYPCLVGRDPDVGDIHLRLALPDGQVDILYFSP
jgi:hypothetical protein